MDTEASADSKSQRERMQQPVRLRLNGNMPSFASKKLEKCSRRPNNASGGAIYNIVSSQRPSAIHICSLRPDTLRENESTLWYEGRVLIYQEPSMDLWMENPLAGRQLSSHANSAECFRLVAYWIQSCLTDHEQCRRVICPYEYDDEPDDYWDTESGDSDIEMYFDSEDLGADKSHLSKTTRSDAPADDMDGDSLSDYHDHNDRIRRYVGVFIKVEEAIRKKYNLESLLFTEEQFLQMVTKPPASLDEMHLISGINTENVDKYGPSFLPFTKCLREMMHEDSLEDQKRQTHSKFPKKRCPLGRGHLTRKTPVVLRNRGSQYGFDDCYLKLYFRSRDLEELNQERSLFQSKVNCERATPPPLLPTRYLNVDSNPPRLCVAEDGARGFYVALSHCWGKTQPLRTTSATIADRLISIPTADMPQTFRDAVLITRELGLEYLWIDSLCIVQDSQEDWEKESAKMGDIYRHLPATAGATIPAR